MIFFNSIIGTTKGKRTNLLSRLTFNKTIIRGAKSGKNAGKIPALASTVSTPPKVCVNKNAFSSNFSQNLQPRVSQQGRYQQASTQLPGFLKHIPVGKTVQQVSAPISTSTTNTVKNNPPTNISLIPKSSTSYSSLFSKIDTRSSHNPTGIFTDYKNPVFLKFLPHTGKSFSCKIFLGVKIYDYSGTFTGLWFGHLYSTKEIYTNSQGFLDKNEKISNTTTIKGGFGKQFRSIGMIAKDNDLTLYSGPLDSNLAQDGLLEIDFYSVTYNTMLSTNPGTVAYTLACKIDPGLFWFSDPNNR